MRVGTRFFDHSLFFSVCSVCSVLMPFHQRRIFASLRFCGWTLTPALSRGTGRGSGSLGSRFVSRGPSVPAAALVGALVLTLVGGGCRGGAGRGEPIPALQTLSLGAGRAPTRGGDGALVVGTFNVRWLDDRAGVRRAVAALPRVNVWCFQEVRVRGDDAAAVAAALGPVLPPGRWHVAAARVNRLREIGSRDWEAQAVVSRFPIDDARGWALDASGAKRRVALVAQIDVGGRAVCVVNTDHEPSFFSGRDGNRRQVGRLAARLGQWLGGGEADGCVVVAGDFNCAGNLWRGYGNAGHVVRVDRALAPLGLRPAAPPARAATFSAWPLWLRLDRVYARGARVTRSGVGRPGGGSDHAPVWCALEVGQ